MRYKELVLRKLDELDNIQLGLQSLLSTPSTTVQQVENQMQKHKNKVEEIRTLINSEQG
jgi:hypothetical protein